MTLKSTIGSKLKWHDNSILLLPIVDVVLWC